MWKHIYVVPEILDCLVYSFSHQKIIGMTNIVYLFSVLCVFRDCLELTGRLGLEVLQALSALLWDLRFPTCWSFSVIFFYDLVWQCGTRQCVYSTGSCWTTGATGTTCKCENKHTPVFTCLKYSLITFIIWAQCRQTVKRQKCCIDWGFLQLHVI